MFVAELKKRPALDRPTLPLAVWASREAVTELLSLYDGWRALLPYPVEDTVARLREKNEVEDDADEKLRVGACIPAWLVDEFEAHAERYDRRRSYVMSKCLEDGLQDVDLEKLLTVYKDLKPTMSLVVVAALKCGFKRWELKYGSIKYAGKLDRNSAERSFGPCAAAAGA